MHSKVQLSFLLAVMWWKKVMKNIFSVIAKNLIISIEYKKEKCCFFRVLCLNTWNYVKSETLHTQPRFQSENFFFEHITIVWFSRILLAEAEHMESAHRWILYVGLIRYITVYHFTLWKTFRAQEHVETDALFSSHLNFLYMCPVRPLITFSSFPRLPLSPVAFFTDIHKLSFIEIFLLTFLF